MGEEGGHPPVKREGSGTERDGPEMYVSARQRPRGRDRVDENGRSGNGSWSDRDLATGRGTEVGGKT